MKTKIMILLAALMVFVVVLLGGCRRQNAEQSAPTATSPAENHPIPRGTASNEIVLPPPQAAPPPASPANTNSPAPTNPPAVNQ